MLKTLLRRCQQQYQIVRKNKTVDPYEKRSRRRLRLLRRPLNILSFLLLLTGLNILVN